MIDQICDYQNDLAKSIKAQRHPFVGEAIKRLAVKFGLTLTHFRDGTPTEDKLGGDVIAHFVKRLEPLYIDLKLTTNPDSQRATLEFERGNGQLGTPWSIDGAKGDVVLWVHTSERIAYFAMRQRLADTILNPSPLMPTFLTSGQRIIKRQREGHETICHLYHRPNFIQWLERNKIGGLLE